MYSHVSEQELLNELDTQAKKNKEFRRKRKETVKQWQTEDGKRFTQLNTLRIRAEKRGIPFSIVHTDIVWPTHCPILGIELVRSTADRSASPSLDRINPKLGYIKGNVRVISRLANTMKSNATPEQMEIFSKNIIPYLKGEI